MPARKATFDATFATLRGILEPYAKTLTAVERPGKYELYSPTMKDRIGRPMFIGAVHINKNYVSLHLMPVYAAPDLVKNLSPALRKRMQGKSCFNFTTIEAAYIKELAALTKDGIERFTHIKLPW